jgi:predicted HNH restriction endonuclease
MTQRDQSYPQHAREARSYTLSADARNISRPGTIRESRWPTIEMFSGHPNGVLLANREGGVSRRHLYMLERNGLLRFDTSASLVAVLEEDDESRYPEGRESFKKHRRLERDGELPMRAKRDRLAAVGHLSCDVCRFNFSNVYGALGEGFIEAHHTVPIAEMAGERKTKLSELALVCSNCHRMLHRGSRLLSVAELQALIRNAGEA